ncbi:uncharacterized protein LOC6580681 [Drosophila mojavensis]|uniref:Uncharacterized protein n=1 Tax=Drosophila mojavensis TaxID=7230 RepID=B4KRK2_DROMO|nr:uncharacterized protein LOC6580681 [Drosophila mojavensis]EDW10428.2 uncharacterized protein Dmoj_GI18542 [Drosophila mojavensis]
MTSIVGYIPSPTLDGAIPLWHKFDWSPEIEHDIYRDWGTYYFNRRRETFALYYYTKALDIDNYDYMTLYRRSQVQRKAARIEQALTDARLAAKIGMVARGPNCPINLQICDALFELNQFENSAIELHDNIRSFIGVKAKNFQTRVMVVNDVIKDVTSRAMSLFFMKNRKLIQRVREINKAKEFVDTRPLWKILRDQKKCDVLSIPEIIEEILSPLEVSRRARAFNVIHQNYLNDSWYDVLFMKNLRNNPSLLLDQCKRSKSFLKTLAFKQYEIIRQFIKMLQSRSPQYYVSFLKFPDKKMLEKNREAYLFRIQYQTHRNMIHDLQHIRKLRKAKDLKELAAYVEKVMGDYYVTKTNRVMCWKFEFHNEVYNTLALALCEQYRVPKNFKVAQRAMLKLLMLPVDKVKDIVPFVFGDRSTYQEGDEDVEGRKCRKMSARLEKRMRFSKFSIEKCYLFHQMAANHLSQLHYDECCFNARRSMKESQNCNSLIWRFLGVIQMIKATTLQHKIERTKDLLEEALPIAKQLKSPQLIRFIDVCLLCTDDEYSRKMSSIASQRASKASTIFSGQEIDMD